MYDRGSVYIYEYDDSITGWLFTNCWYLKTAIIGDHLKEIQPHTFDSCVTLSSLQFGENVEQISDYAFGACKDLKSIIFPDKLTTIKGGAFAACYSLESIYTNNVEKIGSFAFSTCPIKKLHIGKHLNYLGGSVFDELIQTIIIDTPNPPTVEYDDCFKKNTYLNAEVYVPCSSIEKYTTAPVWKNFFNIKGMDNGIYDLLIEKSDNGYTVYSLNGSIVMETENEADVFQLPSGIYIVNGKKYIVK